MKQRLEEEVKLRTQLQEQISTLLNANEKEKDEMRRRSFECKVMSEEGILFFPPPFCFLLPRYWVILLKTRFNSTEIKRKSLDFLLLGVKRNQAKLWPSEICVYQKRYQAV